jgi:hypothetical protein
MSDVIINSINIDRWKWPISDVEIRLTLDGPIVTPEGGVFGTEPVFVARGLCTIASAVVAGITQYTLTIPSLTLPATGNALVGRTARYTAGFYKSSTGQFIQAWPGFESFSLSSSPSPVDWGTIKVANDGGILPYGDAMTFNRSEILSLIGAYVRKLVGWGTPTGTVARTTFATYTAPVISASPTQVEVQALADHVQILSQRLAALITDVKQ